MVRSDPQGWRTQAHWILRRSRICAGCVCRSCSRTPRRVRAGRLIAQLVSRSNHMANPHGQLRDKPFRDALRMEAKLAEQGDETPAAKGSLRWIARQMLVRAGEETAAAKEVADRLDGKVPQAVVGDDEHAPVNMVQRIERVIVDPANPNGAGLPEAT